MKTKKHKMVEINIDAAKKLARLLDKLEADLCVGCNGQWHDEQCSAREAFQLRNYLTQRINNPNRDFNV